MVKNNRITNAYEQRKRTKTKELIPKQKEKRNMKKQCSYETPANGRCKHPAKEVVDGQDFCGIHARSTKIWLERFEEWKKYRREHPNMKLWTAVV